LSGVPVPGQIPGSMTSMSILRYTGFVVPTVSTIASIIPWVPMVSISQVRFAEERYTIGFYVDESHFFIMIIIAKGFAKKSRS
jgi:hypothetical protein